MQTDPVKKPSGYARMRAKGLTSLHIECTPEESQLIREAAKADRRSYSGFLLAAGIERAEKILAEKKKIQTIPLP